MAACAAGFLLLQAALQRLPWFEPMTVSYLAQIAAPMIAATVAWRLGRKRERAQSLRWRLVALAFLLWAGGMASSMCLDVFASSCAATDSINITLYLSYGVPMLLVLATPPSEWASPAIRWIDAAMVLVLVASLVVNTVLVATGSAIGTEAQAAGFIWMFDAENVLLMLFALIRVSTATNSAAWGLYLSLAVHTTLYLPIAWFYNHYVVATWNVAAGSAYDLLVGVPFLAFVVTASAVSDSGRSWREGSSFALRFASVVPPFFLTITVVVVAAITARSTFYFGMVCTILAILGYGVRSSLQQAHHIGVVRLAEQDRDAMATLAWRDALTGVANRRAFDAAVDLEWNRAERSGGDLGLLMIDIDEFKAINDHDGHVAGDQVIRGVGQALASVASLSRDVLARYGGEEFACLMPGTSLEQARSVAERMRAAVEESGLRHPVNARGVVTVSIGVASMKARESAGSRLLVAASDQALYEAKRGGRNRVCG